MPHARVLLVDDEPFVRSMLTSALSAVGIDAVACASSKEALADESGCDVAVLDLDLGPGPTGVDVAHALRGRRRDMGLVLLTGYSDPRIHDPNGRPLPRGTRLLTKGSLEDISTLRDAILDARRDPLRAVGSCGDSIELTSNQIAVLRLVARGMSNAEIAGELGVGEKAIERTIGRILEALNVERSQGNSRIQLARSYFEMAGKALP